MLLATTVGKRQSEKAGFQEVGNGQYARGDGQIVSNVRRTRCSSFGKCISSHHSLRDGVGKSTLQLLAQAEISKGSFILPGLRRMRRGKSGCLRPLRLLWLFESCVLKLYLPLTLVVGSAGCQLGKMRILILTRMSSDEERIDFQAQWYRVYAGNLKQKDKALLSARTLIQWHFAEQKSMGRVQYSEYLSGAAL